MRLAIFVFFILLTATPSLAGGFRGAQVFAAMSDRFNEPSPWDVSPRKSACDRLLEMLAPVPYPAMAVLWGTFGDNPACLERFIRTFRDRPHLIEIHFSNETCRRSNGARPCLAGEFLPELNVAQLNAALERLDSGALGAIFQRTQSISTLMDEIYSHNTHIILSIGLEDQYSQFAAIVMELHIRNSGWRYGLSRNHVNGKVFPALSGWVETHAAAAARRPPLVRAPLCIYGEDGNTVSLKHTKEVLKKYANCLVVYAWRQEWQNFPPPNGAFIPPRDRFFEIFDADVEALGALLATAP